MQAAAKKDLLKLLEKIDRPGSFCASGSAPAVFPGLEVEGLGPVGLPLTASQAKELKKYCEQAPYGKGEETLVDTRVRRVWHLTPERFQLINPEWKKFLQQTVTKVQEELGLEKQKLESHLYDLLLYEPGSFFLPHRDGEKLDRMVATLVLVLPSAYKGGELVVRHDGKEKTIDFSDDSTQFLCHFAAFYADCEHEIRPLKEGHRLCLVYNLTLAKGKKGLKAPTSAEHVEPIARILREWAKDDEAGKLVITMDHQYSKDGLVWDTLKGTDRVKAHVLAEAAGLADCQMHLALLTYHESGQGEYAGGGGRGYHGRRSRWDDDEEEEEDEDSGEYEMVEVYDSSLSAEHWSDRDGNKHAIGEMNVEEEELLDPEALEAIDPEEDFEGYTGNAGMTLERWYRHAAIFLWPNRLHFEVMCDVGTRSASESLKRMAQQWNKSSPPDETLKAQCLDFAGRIMARWGPNPYGRFAEDKDPCPLFHALTTLGDPALLHTYLRKVLSKDATVDPTSSIGSVCQKLGWKEVLPDLKPLYENTTGSSILRNVAVLDHLCQAKPRKDDGWKDLCQTLASTLVGKLEGLENPPATTDYGARSWNRARVLLGLARTLLASGQDELLSQVVDHALARPEKYPLVEAHVTALTSLQPWLKKNLKKPSPPLTRWLETIRRQFEALTAKAPEAPKDQRRPANVPCKCADCAELRRFLQDPAEASHRFTAGQDRRSHLENIIRNHHLDLTCRTEERGRPYTLVCTKTTASHEAAVKKYHEDQKRQKAVREIEAALPG